VHQITIWGNAPSHDLGYPKLRFGISQIMIWDNAQIAIWDNAPNRDLGYTKLRFGTKFDLGPTYVPNQNVDLGHPKSEDRFGISQIVISSDLGYNITINDMKVNN